jgi:hypothetical protein
MELVVDPSNRAAASARRLTICDQFSTSEKVKLRQFYYNQPSFSRTQHVSI